MQSSSSLPNWSNDNTTSVNNTVMGAVIGVPVSLVAAVLITIVCIALLYLYKRRSAVNQQKQQNTIASTCTLPQLCMHTLDDGMTISLC